MIEFNFLAVQLQVIFIHLRSLLIYLVLHLLGNNRDSLLQLENFLVLVPRLLFYQRVNGLVMQATPKARWHVRSRRHRLLLSHWSAACMLDWRCEDIHVGCCVEGAVRAHSNRNLHATQGLHGGCLLGIRLLVLEERLGDGLVVR